MTDCPSAEMRDRLPDLLHERLEPTDRAAILAHLEGCADCRSEFALLGDLRGALARTPHVDVAHIVAALPQPSRQRLIPVSWRIAASITILAVGGTSVATVIHRRVRASPQSPVVATTGQRRGPAIDRVAASELSVTGLGDLSVPELQTLRSDIEVFDALPSAEPDIVAPSVRPAVPAETP